MMNIQPIAIEKINPAPYNPREDLRPGDARYDALTRSVDEFGLVEPLVWNRRSGHLVGGHQRLKVLVARGATEADAVVVDLPPKKKKALNLALNRIQGDWDRHRLAELIQAPELDIELTGFELDEARDLVIEQLGDDDAEPAEDFDADAELDRAGPPITQPGEILQLGPHRLMCGDATDPQHVRRLMNGERAALFATDPPYLVGYDPQKRSSPRNPRKQPAADGDSAEGVTWDDPEAQPELYSRFIAAARAEALDGYAAWYCWHASRNHAMVEQAWAEHGALVHCQIIWVKPRGVPTRSWYLWRHEPCLMGWVQGNMPERVQQERAATVWELSAPDGADRPDHPTPKPLGVFEIPMRQHTRPGAVCYEPFAGSGSQLIAAERLQRRCFAMELSPRYCDLIVRRYLAFVDPQSPEASPEVSPEIIERYTADASETAEPASAEIG